ncbi:RNA-dependent RNA polymerase [Colletotrichum zoysiae totivirus 1]|nr:RNA-dependent RNA polymerase [Colletotrichum zoysiae totivirus 1]
MKGLPVHERAKATGALGQYLKGLLPRPWLRRMATLDFAAQLSETYAPQWMGVNVTPLRRAAGAFLCPAMPIQVQLPKTALLELLYATLPPGRNLTPKRNRPTAVGWSTSAKRTKQLFPPKGNPAATNKVNVYLSEVMSSLGQLSGTLAISFEDTLAAYAGSGMANDAAAAIVLYGYGLSHHGVDDPSGVAARLITNPDYCKALTTFIKAVGANGTPLGALLAEANTLQGRDVGNIDLFAEAGYRTTSAHLDSVATYDEDTLRRHIRHFLSLEISRADDSYLIQYPTLDEHWNSRWNWAVNGAHSNIATKHLSAAPRPPGVTREHRRAWLERVEQDPRPDWDGTTYASLSPKLEHGKTRAIYACDTLNYLSFEHLMSSVERRWRHQRIVLDPGKGGAAGMIFRTQAARARAGVSMMLDYDDFNSQHSTRAMQILIEETCAMTGYPQALTEKLVQSFDKIHVYVGGEYVGRVLGTLMSGHRCTTYINSVLNAVYLRIEMGDELFDKAVSLHVGDDVYLGVASYAEATMVQQRLAGSQLRMNPMKQSVGHVSTEFLRVACAGRDARGYFARAVSSVISGNWVTDLVLGPLEALTSMCASARTLVNRSGAGGMPLLLLRSVIRMTKLPKEDHARLAELLLGNAALGNGPMYAAGPTYRSIRCQVIRAPPDDHGYSALPSGASTDYLTNLLTPLESTVLTEAGISPLPAMLEASWSKTLPRDSEERVERLRLRPARQHLAVGSDTVERLVRVPKVRGVLSEYPILYLIKDRLTGTQLRRAIAMAGGDPNAADLQLEAWGERSHGCIIASPMDWATASTYGRLTQASVLTCSYNLYI